MLTGLEILLERMKTNPEEFVEGGYSKWSRVLDTGWSIMTEEERQALQAGMHEAKRDHFNGEVMRVLAQGHDDSVGMGADMEDRFYNGKRLMQGSFSAPSAIITPQSMIEQVKDTLDKQFDEAYARKDTKTMKSVSKLKNAMRK